MFTDFFGISVPIGAVLLVLGCLGGAFLKLHIEQREDFKLAKEAFKDIMSHLEKQFQEKDKRIKRLESMLDPRLGQESKKTRRK
ncbi:hypothetical protein [Streptococcus sp. NLN64]|uniref:hypothetical protein n=1 Tax=Streptococcus sp. NLN64 TaxID=2822799 RepID=UPI0018C93505|nr:hypothetical protein [Streptococcus sp. NLN64]MBG9366571.1 hypothetical protein [Streptococcus sp. NLN64]